MSWKNGGKVTWELLDEDEGGFVLVETQEWEELEATITDKPNEGGRNWWEKKT